MKRLLAIILSVLLILGLISCGNTDTAPSGENPYSSLETGDTLQFGGEDWRVLDVQDGKALIISEKVLKQKEYHSEFTDITWETCDLRAYLNDEFYKSFSAAEQKRIAETKVINNDNPWFDTSGGNDTIDKIFLLSLDEVVKYFGDSGQLANRLNEETYWIDDQYNDARIAYNLNGASSWWWLRSPGYDSGGAVYVFSDGDISTNGNAVNCTDGVRPALWLSLE